jgi:tetrapyrrole methylase family protein/MazG family protein
LLDALLAEARLRWGLDPADGFAVVPAERLIGVPLEPSRPTLLVPLAVLHTAPPAAAPAAPPAPLPGRHGPAGRDALAVLRRLYPADHPVGRFGVAEATTVGALVKADLAAPLYLAPVAPELAAASPWGMPWISNRLREPDGCPWDREQTHESLRNHLLEEAYEVYDALAGGATPELAAELGDLWLQVVLHAQLAAEAGVFDLADVQAAIASKIVRRHPHVFGDAEVHTATDVNRQWERIKQAERAEEAAASAASSPDGEPAPPPKSALDGVSRSMPALAASQEMQERAAHLGYDWPSIDGILAKVAEELGELTAAEGSAARAEELGDLLMVVVNLARHHDVDAEAALRSGNEKFRRRFGIVERLAAERAVALRDLSFAELDALWDAAKAELATESAPAGQNGPEEVR